MTSQKHILNKVSLNLSLAKENGHFATQKRWAKIFKKEVVPALSKIFDEQVPPDEIWRVEKLAIDLGDIPEGTSDREIAKLIVQQVTRSFEDFQISANGKLNKLSVKMAEMEALVFFLKTGSLPGSALDLDLEKVFWETVKENFNGFMVLAMHQFGSIEIERVAKRLAWQFSEKDLLKFLEIFIRENGSATLEWLPVFYRKLIAVERQFTTQLKEQFWVVFFKIIFDKTLMNKNLGKIFYYNYLNKIAALNIEKTVFKEALQTVPKSVGRQMGKVAEGGRKTLLKKERQVEVDVRRKLSETEDETIGGLFCKNAGVVLLHPFMPRSFRSISLLGEDGKSFKDKDKMEEAVYWLHFLATGKEGAVEHELALPKLLCGLKMAAPVRKGLSFKKEKIKEAEAMLKAAIEHWKALKNTSPDGLREGFLQRQGRLTKKQNGFLLEMENKPQDILLGKLPWGMSVVHLPWMELPLWV